MRNKSWLAATIPPLLSMACQVAAQALPEHGEDCRTIGVDMERLACYDRLHGRSAPAANAPSQDEAPSVASPAVAPTATARESSRMSAHWELDRASKHGLFDFRPHRENYLLATYNPRPNGSPYEPLSQLEPNARLAHGELAFQLGFKLKAAENPGNLPLDLWFGYTQRSFWQAGNSEASSPFRESNYEPELMAVVPTSLHLAGVNLRFLNLGLTHQSNGGGSILSRSWNRVYLQAGLESGDFQLLARIWKRINENAGTDDNPDIIDYLGRGDLKASYRWREHEFSLLTRYNFHTSKGAAQLSWAFPLTTHLKGYLQYFTGYGYSLIDYNAYQRVLGLGVMVAY